MKLLFAGTPDFAATTLRALLASQHTVAAVLTQPDKPAGRGRKATPSKVKQLALEAECPVLQPSTLKDESIQATLRAFEADLMIVAVYGLLLPPEVLNLPRLGCLNVHASLLPRWRGASPIQQAILAGDEQTGITLMKMDEGLDTGDMLIKSALIITPTDTAASLHDKLAPIGAQALVEYLDGLEANQATALQGEQQDALQSTHAPKIQKQDACIDWSQSAAHIERAIRAYLPWPICFSHLNEQPIRFWRATIANQTETGIPGKILQADTTGLFVQTGQGVLQATTLQLPGKKPLPFSDIYNGYADLFKIGHVFR